MEWQEKREHRQLKREVKRAGHKHDRNSVKRALTESPEDAHEHVEPNYGRHVSSEMNGIDRDSTRRRRAEDGPAS